jgi:hypothetical protein
MFRGYQGYSMGSGYRTNAGVNPQWEIVRGKVVSSRNSVTVFSGYEILCKSNEIPPSVFFDFH